VHEDVGDYQLGLAIEWERQWTAIQALLQTTPEEVGDLRARILELAGSGMTAPMALAEDFYRRALTCSDAERIIADLAESVHERIVEDLIGG